jgi:transcriptional regulator with XRE-family HTH domain
MKSRTPGTNNSKGSSALGTWLKERCQKERLSYRQVAAKAGVSHATISDIINGGRPSAATIVKLADAFGNGGSQKAELEDLLLSLSGYRSERKEKGKSESMARVIDKLKQLNPEQLELIENLAIFITKAGKPGMRSLRSSTGVLVLPKLRLNFYLSLDDEEPELSHFSSLPHDMQETIVALAERYKNEVGQGHD